MGDGANRRGTGHIRARAYVRGYFPLAKTRSMVIDGQRRCWVNDGGNQRLGDMASRHDAAWQMAEIGVRAFLCRGAPFAQCPRSAPMPDPDAGRVAQIKQILGSGLLLKVVPRGTIFAQP